MTTVGYGDIHLKDAAPGVKLFGIFLMLASAALLAATFGFITDYLLKMRLEQMLGLRRLRMKDHIVLCGLGHVGIRVLEQLRRLRRAGRRRRKERGGPLRGRGPGDGGAGDHCRRPPAVADGAGEHPRVRGIIVATDDDLVNLEVALDARAIRPDIRVVLRMFDHNLASKIRSGFGIKTTFSTSALAAPAFAMAAVEPAVVGSFYVGEDLMLILQTGGRGRRGAGRGHRGGGRPARRRGSALP